MRYFVDGGIVWEADCVTGGMNQGEMHHTPTGVYYINDNMQSGNVELRGEIDPATNQPKYISYVRYWMPFIDNSHALHDADWRSSFGGDIYLSFGSHGCINLPPRRLVWDVSHTGCAGAFTTACPQFCETPVLSSCRMGTLRGNATHSGTAAGVRFIWQGDR